jgi:hypothetical protein
MLTMRSGRAALGLLTVCIAVGILWLFGARWRVEILLSRLPEAQSVRVVDHGEFGSWVVALVRVQGGGEIAFYGLTPEAFSGDAPILVTHIADMALVCDHGDGIGFGYSAKITDDSTSHAPGLGITDVRSALAHYGELKALVEGMPRSEDAAVRSGATCWAKPQKAQERFLHRRRWE